MARQYQPYELNRIAEFGTIKSVRNEYTGVNIPQFVSEFKLHYATIKRTLDQQYQLVGTSIADTILIVIRHNSKVNDALHVTLRDGIEYRIESISADDSNNYLTYDILTLAKVQKGGG